MSAGIKETQEVVDAVFAAGVLLVKVFKNGVQPADALSLLEALLNDAAFQAKIGAAVKGIEALPAELGDIDLFEGLALGKQALADVKLLVAEFKKPA